MPGLVCKALHTYRSISALFLISSTIVWCWILFAVHFWIPDITCNIHIYGGAITNSSNDGPVKIINILTYGNQEDAYHLNNTWICVKQDGVISKDRVEILKQHRVRYDGL